MSKQPDRIKQNQAPRASYTQEFRDEAVRLTVSSGKSVAQVARDLGVKLATLHKWRRHARYDHRLPVAEDETPEQKITRLQEGTPLLDRFLGCPAPVALGSV